MANVAVTISASGPDNTGQGWTVRGTLTLSAGGTSYASGGDSLASQQLALSTVESLILGLPQAAASAAITSIIFPVVRTTLPARNTTILIQAFLDTNTEASGDLSAFIIPFVAYGVGS